MLQNEMFVHASIAQREQDTLRHMLVAEARRAARNERKPSHRRAFNPFAPFVRAARWSARARHGVRLHGAR